ncbi:CHAT domain-containing protein [Chromobacterium sp. Beijing]|uniref:CHAT domain-containing protein n=1 Tax=Chromobacterium sp. Beijing TaxID=2735795 RepID=UPI001F309601|nr:CHAT domain-containing protein [Chromobacterium sp. Beijing]UJB31376.1 CHAT domain-containing protein [Chromobacterium sp. Beijing]
MSEEGASLDGFHPSMLFNAEHIPEPGSAVLVLHTAQEQVVSRCTMAAFMLRDKVQNRSIYKGLTFIAPPTKVWTRDAEATFELLLSGVSEVRGKQLAPEEHTTLKSMFNFVRCESLESQRVLDAVEAAGNNQFIFVPWVTLYTGLSVHSSAYKQGGVRLEEDTWVHETARLATELIAQAEQKEGFVLMSSPAEPPVKAASKDLLLAIENLSVAGFYENDQEAFMSRLAWMNALAASGRAEEALAELQAEDLPELIKRQVRVKITHRSGDSEAAARMIRELLEEIAVSGTTATQWAAICLQGGDTATARTLLGGALDQVSQEQALTASLQMATEIGDAQLVKRAWIRLKDLFPENESLQFDCELRLLRICRQDADEAQANPVDQTGFSEYHTLLADKLRPGTELDYPLLLNEIGARWPEHHELTVMCAARHAEKSGEIEAALTLASQLIPDTRFSPAAARLVVRVMGQLLLAEAIGPDELAIYTAPLWMLIEHLGQHPTDAELRALLVSTLSIESAGRNGLPLIAAVAFDLAETMSEPAEEQSGIDVASPQEFSEFLQRLDSWASQNFVLDPSMTLPAEVVGANAAGLSRLVRKSIEQEALEGQSLQELEELNFQVHLLPPLTRHVPGASDDIHALRVLTGKYSLLGQHQRARDLAELILKMTGDSPERKRLAWGAYADIYLRSYSFTDALVGLACAAATQARLPASELFQERYALLRIARDLGFLKQAEKLLEACRRLFAMMGMTDLMRHRLNVIDLTLRMPKLSTTDLPSLKSLLEGCKHSLIEAIELKDELNVAAFLFAQVIGVYERTGGEVPADVSALKDKVLGILDPDAAFYLRTLAAARPSSSDLVALHNRSCRPRYSHDAPGDAVAVNVATHRLLRPVIPEIEPQDAFLAMELLAERGLTLATTPDPMTTGWPMYYAQSLAQQFDLSVLMVALDDQGQLVAAIADSTGAYVERPPISSDSTQAQLRTWSKKYPYGYGLIDPKKKVKEDERGAREREVGDKEFYDSMSQFSVPMPHGKRVLVVAEPKVAQLTFNLVIGREGRLVGYDTSIGVVPSLTWLASISRQPTGRDGRRMAWISHSGDAEELRAMDVVKAMIENTLSRYDIILDTSSTLPQDFQGAQMAIVTAHGQLTQENRYFHRIVDEGTLQESPLALAQALADTELVILFVCSGGRVDRHPIMSTTVGLPKMLLDNGCRTVIASPWPLESLAPGAWLPAFLEHWEQGATAMDACHLANLHVASRREHEPQVSLAMTVYGDPLLVRTSST